MFKLSVKHLVIGLSVVALISVLTVSLLSWSLASRVSDGQVKLKESASLMQAESALGKLVNEVLENTISSSSSQSLDMLSQSQPVKDAQIRFNSIFIQLKDGLNDSSQKQLNKLNTDFNQLLLSEENVRIKTKSILENQLQIESIAKQVDLLSEELQKSSASLVGKISLSSKRVKRGLKKLVRNNQLLNSPSKTKELVDATKMLVGGNQDKLATASNRLMVAVAKLSSVAQKLISAPTKASIIDLEQNQGLQLVQMINKNLKNIYQFSSGNSSFITIQKDMDNKKIELVALLFGENDSVKTLRNFNLSEQINREEALKTMVSVVKSLSKVLINVSKNAQQLQLNVVTETDDSINSVTTINSFVFIIVLLLLISSSIFVTRMITKPLSEIAIALKEISSGEGDLTKRLKVKGVDEVVQLSEYFNHFVSKIQLLMRSVADASQEISASVIKTNEISINSKQNTALQQSATQQLATVMEELSHSFAEVADSASHASKNSEESTREANQGLVVVKNSVKSVEVLATKIDSGVSAMESLASTSQSVANVLDVIKGIADQTNLLALNAAIEAARAGEQGRGFAVVADEVRALASKTQVSTGQISDILENLKLDASEASKVMSEGKILAEESVTQSVAVSTTLDKILVSISGIADLNYQISSSASEQSKAAGEAAQNVEQINDISRKNTEASSLMEESSQSLDRLSENLQGSLAQFKI